MQATTQSTPAVARLTPFSPRQIERAESRLLWALGMGGLDYSGVERGAVDRFIADGDEATLQDWTDGACEDVCEDVALCRALLTLSPAEMAVWFIHGGDISWWSLSEAAGGDHWLGWVVAALAEASAWPEALS